MSADNAGRVTPEPTVKMEGEMIGMLKLAIRDAGSLRNAAGAFGVSAAYLSDVMNNRRAVGPKLAAGLGYSVEVRRITRRTYVPLSRADKRARRK